MRRDQKSQLNRAPIVNINATPPESLTSLLDVKSSSIE